MNIDMFPFDGKLLARPGQSLEQHLSAVRRALDQIAFKIPFYSIPIDGFNNDSGNPPSPSKIDVKLPSWLVMDLLKILVAVHDFGKISPFFQLKIRKVKIGKAMEPLSYHTKTSAFFAYFLIDEYFKYHDIKEEEKISRSIQHLFKTLIPYCIMNHHTPKLKTTFLDPHELVSETLVTVAILREYVLPHQFTFQIPNTPVVKGNLTDFFSSVINFHVCRTVDHKQIVDNALKRFFELSECSVNLENPIIPDWEEVATDEFFDLMDDLEDLWEETSKYPVFMPYFLFLHSILGDLDEWDARTFIPETMEHTADLDWNHIFPIAFSSVDSFRKAKFTKVFEGKIADIINVRNQLFDLTNSLELADKSSAYVLEAPTGSAKTLAMLNLAMRIAEKKEKRMEKAPRIIYALPFISITDQVGEVLSQIIEFADGSKDEHLTVHHMFADFPSYIFDPEFDEEKNEIIVGRASAPTRLWHSPFIATTFVSLMNSVFSGMKRNILRFHRLTGSIIILDEIQSLPPKYWEILSRIVDYMIRYLNVDFIIGSATNPKPLAQHIQRAKFPKLPGDLLRQINRYQLQFNNKPESIETAIQRIIADISKLDTRQAMIVVNTKKTCRMVYNELLRTFPEDEVFLLSTWLRPIDRKRSIDAVRNRLDEGLPVILVATQVVEAGVDLDFRTVYRDFAPIDSIIQVAGRCNRNFRYLSGTIHVLNLVNDKGRSFASFIYDKVSLEVTQSLLRPKMHELELRDSIHEYFNLVKQRRKTSELLPEFKNSDLPILAEKFNLIEQDHSIPIAIIPQNQYNSLNFNSKLTIKILSLFSIDITAKQVSLFNYIKRKISGIEILIAIEEDNPIYDKKGGLNP